MRLLRACTFAALAAALAACAPAASGHAMLHNVVTAEDLAPVKDLNLYDALTRVRPRFLVTRDVQTINNPNPVPVHVYLNGNKAEGLDDLRRITAGTVQEVRFYEPQDANTRFGTGNNGGVIDVILKP